jgi:hypothetical protein
MQDVLRQLFELVVVLGGVAQDSEVALHSRDELAPAGELRGEAVVLLGRFLLSVHRVVSCRR